MNQLNFNGIQACPPNWNCKVYKARPCSLLIHVTESNFQKAIEAYDHYGFCDPFQGLYLDGDFNLDFLKRFPNLLYLSINASKPIDTEAIETLSNLRGLQLSEQKSGLNFKNLNELEFFIGKWHNKNAHIEKCKILRELHLNKFAPETKDLSILANIERLEHLSLTKNNITSLEGLQNLEDLLTLNILYSPKLESFEAFYESTSSLREIEISHLPKVNSYKALRNLKTLRKLIISNSSDIQNLSWITELEKLKFFSFLNTTITDGNLKPLLETQSLEYVGTNNKRNYNLTMEEINEKLNTTTTKSKIS